MWPRGWVQVQLYSSMTAALEGGEWSAAHIGRTLPSVKCGTHCTGGWVGPGPVWTGGKSRPHRDSIPDPPARSQSLYRLSYPARLYIYIYSNNDRHPVTKIFTQLHYTHCTSIIQGFSRRIISSGYDAIYSAESKKASHLKANAIRHSTTKAFILVQASIVLSIPQIYRVLVINQLDAKNLVL